MILTYLLVIKDHGSFTGIRIGLSTIKAFCDVTNKPCVGVTSLEGFAYKLFDITDAQRAPLQYICSLVNANHGNAYCGIFKFYNGKLTQTHDYFFDSIDNILEFVNNLEKNIFFTGNCRIILNDMIESDKMQINPNVIISAKDIARCAFDKFCAGDYGDSNLLTPLYLKKSSAESNGIN